MCRKTTILNKFVFLKFIAVNLMLITGIFETLGGFNIWNWCRFENCHTVESSSRTKCASVIVFEMTPIAINIFRGSFFLTQVCLHIYCSGILALSISHLVWISTLKANSYPSNRYAFHSFLADAI